MDDAAKAAQKHGILLLFFLFFWFVATVGVPWEDFILCETPKGLRKFENDTSYTSDMKCHFFFLNKVATGKWVKCQLWLNYPFNKVSNKIVH